jgi:hypothetical protein
LFQEVNFVQKKRKMRSASSLNNLNDSRLTRRLAEYQKTKGSNEAILFPPRVTDVRARQQRNKREEILDVVCEKAITRRCQPYNPHQR